jgi:hypothetical protein
MEKKNEITRIFARKFTKILVFFIFIFALFSVSSTAAEAASLYFSPASGSYTVGKNFSAGIYVSSVDQAMNAASGVISFPADKLEVVSLSKSGSTFNLWVRDPAYSNAAGTINFEGVVLNPGFTGKSGKIITITFRAKAVGTAALSFSSGLVLANDGNGTSILSGLGRASYTLVAAPKTPPVPPAPPVITPVPVPIPVPPIPLSPIVASPTHPDILPWYGNSDPQFAWALAPDITADRIFYDKLPNSRPIATFTYSPPLAEKKFSGLADGVWYLHVQLQNKAGWGDIAHFRFQIDTKPPEQFTLTFVDGKETDNPRPKIVLSAIDSLSGVESYQIKIDDGEIITIPAKAGENTPATLPLQKLGEHNIFAQVFDRAGNYADIADKFIVKSILPPVFTEYPSRLSGDEILVAKGTTYSDSGLIIWLQKENNSPQSFELDSDKNGAFTFVRSEKLNKGVYQLWGEAVDARGAKSSPSSKLTIIVKQPLVWKIGPWAINLIDAIISILALIVLLAVLLWYWRKRKSSRLFQKDIRRQIEILENARARRPLTAEEEGIIKQLLKDLDEEK